MESGLRTGSYNRFPECTWEVPNHPPVDLMPPPHLRVLLLPGKPTSPPHGAMQESHKTKSFSKPTQSIQSPKCKSSPQTASSKSHTDLSLSIFKDTFAALAGLQQTHAGKTTFHHPFLGPHAEPITWSSLHVRVGDVRLSFGYFRLKRIIAS